ncbi:MAG: AbrB/MazE/SpoVT family DNA-binding domain-containing protein [PVC group bacterium]
MQTKVQKWGNSLALRIPKVLALDAHIKEGSLVDIAVSNGEIVAKPTKKAVFDLKELVRQITPKNVHSEIETGEPVGRESW